MALYTLTGTPTLITTALDALVFTPTAHQVTPSDTVSAGITLGGSQIAGAAPQPPPAPPHHHYRQRNGW